MIPKKTRLTLKRVMWVFIPAVLVLVVGVGSLSFYFIHRLTHPAKTQLYGSPRDFQIIMQKPIWSDEKWKNSDGTQTVGWFLTQGKPAPAIILSHAYGSNRSDLLTLGVELYKAGFHILMYDMRGHGESPVNWSGLGTYEKDDLLSTIKFLKEMKTASGEELVDGRIGLYGVDLGGYISLVASSQEHMVKAVAVDSVYQDVSHFVSGRLKNIVGDNSTSANTLVDSKWTKELTGLTMQMYLLRRQGDDSAINAVNAASQKFLFIKGKDASLAANTTQELYDQAKGSKELIEVDKTRQERLYTTDSSAYDARVAAFFKEAIFGVAPKPVAVAKAK
ncbi:MAG: alpha/beta fold hydrolase [Acidobacteria bacterium]|nr:alpha/beta fold hydrolase [Acidobacteriota bacterium]